MKPELFGHPVELLNEQTLVFFKAFVEARAEAHIHARLPVIHALRFDDPQRQGVDVDSQVAHEIRDDRKAKNIPHPHTVATAHDIARKGKKRQLLTPTTFSLVHATDFADRFERQVLPLLRAGYIVLADRYMYTAFARDTARGMSPQWLRHLYSFAIKPDLAFYFKVPIEVSVARLLGGTRAELKYYEAGMDLGLSTNVVESFKIFQSRALDEYDKLVDEFGLTVIDATQEIDEQQEMVREIVSKMLGSYKPKRGTHAKREAIFWRRFDIPESEGTQGQADRH